MFKILNPLDNWCPRKTTDLELSQKEINKNFTHTSIGYIVLCEMIPADEPAMKRSRGPKLQVPLLPVLIQDFNCQLKQKNWNSQNSIFVYHKPETKNNQKMERLAKFSKKVLEPNLNTHLSVQHYIVCRGEKHKLGEKLTYS